MPKTWRAKHGERTSAIRGLLLTYEEALRASDADTLANLYGSDGVVFPDQQPTRSGDEILSGYQSTFKAIKLDLVYTIDDITVDGDTAHALTRGKGATTVLADGAVTSLETRELWVFRRSNREWKIIRYVFAATNA